MIQITFKNDNKEELEKLNYKVNAALVGSPAFINNEVLVSAVEDDTFSLIVGIDNEDDIAIEVPATDINIEKV